MSRSRLRRTTLARLVEDGLRLRAAKAPATVSDLPVFHGRGGLAPGVDGRSNRALLDAAGEH